MGREGERQVTLNVAIFPPAMEALPPRYLVQIQIKIQIHLIVVLLGGH